MTGVLAAGGVLAGIAAGVLARSLADAFARIPAWVAVATGVAGAVPLIGWWLAARSTGSVPIADLVIAALLLPVAVALLLIDLRVHRLPDRLVLAGVLTTLVVAGGSAVGRSQAGDLLDALWVGAAMFAVGYALLLISPEGLGFGDVKLLGLIGLVLGHLAPSLVLLWLLALAVASVGWLLAGRYVDHRYDRDSPWHKRQIAFGPALLTAVWLVYAVLALRPA